MFLLRYYCLILNFKDSIEIKNINISWRLISLFSLQIKVTGPGKHCGEYNLQVVSVGLEAKNKKIKIKFNR